MTEAWLLFDEKALRYAAGNPNGDVELKLPALSAVEDLPDPKKILNDCLRTASGLTGRRLRHWSSAQAVHRLADLMTDFSPLRHLPAFQALEDDLCTMIGDHGWL
jgi:hypothetical protein